MNKLLESAGIALDAIWASKLRSLMTVLGNIVAVTSIIAGERNGKSSRGRIMCLIALPPWLSK